MIGVSHHGGYFKYSHLIRTRKDATKIKSRKTPSSPLGSTKKRKGQGCVKPEARRPTWSDFSARQGCTQVHGLVWLTASGSSCKRCVVGQV